MIFTKLWSTVLCYMSDRFMYKFVYRVDITGGYKMVDDTPELLKTHMQLLNHNGWMFDRYNCLVKTSKRERG